MKICILKGHGACRGKISGEHTISEALLLQIAKDGRVRTGGMPWQLKNTFQRIGVGSLRAKILCEGHNSGLSPLDTTVSNLFRAINAADKTPELAPDQAAFSGPSVERWFLKALLGHEAAKDPRLVPEEWKAILIGGSWPEGWGLYVAASGSRVFAGEVFMETRVHPGSGKVLAASFSVGGVLFWLLLGKPDVPGAFGLLRPRGLILINAGKETRLEFQWPFETDVAVIYVKVATTGEDPPHWAEFSDEAG